jgi:hypothetical protein
VWPLESRIQLQAAQELLGGATHAPAYIDDLGLRYIHILISAFGGPSLIRLQVLQILLDTLAVLAVWRIAELIGNARTARLAALLYALYLPQVMLALVPSYDVWATWALLVPTWLVLESIHAGGQAAGLLAALAGSSTALLSIVRSTTMFYGLAAAFVLVGFRRYKLGVSVLVGWIAVITPLTIYKHGIFGEVRPIRSNVAHVFWAGVGQFPNDYGVEATDESVNALYHRLTGKSDYNSQEYESYLESAARVYLGAHKTDYVAAAVKRTGTILFPRNYWGPWPDQWNKEFAESLLLLGRSPGEFAKRYPVTTGFGVVGRIMDWLVLPAGLLVGLVMLWRRPPVIAALPLLYTVVTLGPIYVTSRNTANAYAATMPLCALGLWQILNFLGKPNMNSVGQVSTTEECPVENPHHQARPAVVRTER